MMSKIFTEIRIFHKTKEEKVKYESSLREVLKEQGYKSRVEWFNEKYRELMQKKKVDDK